MRLRDLSAFTDPDLNWMMEGVRQELTARRASVLRVQGLAHLIAVHLARNCAGIPMDLRGASAALPGFKLKQVTDWIETHLDEEFDLDSLAAKADLSKFHFHRLFKQATGLSPAKFQLDARMKEARRRLRETNMPLLTYIKEISPRPILFIHGEKAHSRYFSETAYTAAAEPKELLIIPGASHVDLYDRMDKIPFERIAAFCAEHLK